MPWKRHGQPGEAGPMDTVRPRGVQEEHQFVLRSQSIPMLLLLDCHAVADGSGAEGERFGLRARGWLML